MRIITRTFAIIGYDSLAKEWGIAVATNNLSVGSSTIYIQPGAGAIAVIADTDPRYGIEGLKYLSQGMSPEKIMELLRQNDVTDFVRQVGIIDRNGSGWAFTGYGLQFWEGYAGQRIGKDHIIIGNTIQEAVLDCMASTFVSTKGPLADRLLASLQAGERVGGQIDGKQSAALVVNGIQNEWYDQVNLRIDHSLDPFADIDQLYNFHKGRRELDRAAHCFLNDNISVGRQLVLSAEKKLKGFVGMYEQLIASFIFLGEINKAVEWVKRALSEEPKWKHTLPAFHILAAHPELKEIINENEFTHKDWYKAIGMYYDLNRVDEGISLSHLVVKNLGNDAYAFFLLGKGYMLSGDSVSARNFLIRSFEIDPNNPEVIRYLKSFTT